MSQAKPFPIAKRQVWEAYQRVKANQGGAGVDGQTIERFEQHLGDNLYKLWNRMASGSYMPPPVKRVEIPKGDGRVRPLGIPTVADRVAQMVVKRVLEPEMERQFHPDSYGYWPGKSAHQALAKARERCWRYDWVVDLDIKGFLELSSYCSPIDASCASMSLLSHNPFCFSALRHDYGDRPVAGSSDLTHCNSALQAMRRARTGSGGHRRGA